MQHPFSALAPEYVGLMAHMQITRTGDVDAVAERLVSLYRSGHYTDASRASGVPIVWMAASFEREASSNFDLSPAQGDRWDRVSVHVPRGLGPYASWTEAAVDAYRHDGLDKVGAANWSWARACYESELFNGFGYRAHGVPSPYLWGGTTVQRAGKYVVDGAFDSGVWDRQIGVVPIMARMVVMAPELTLGGAWPFVGLIGGAIPTPAAPPLGVGGGDYDAAWIQRALNQAGADPQLIVDGNYGRRTRAAVVAFQRAHGLEPDGIVGPKTLAALRAA